MRSLSVFPWEAVTHCGQFHVRAFSPTGLSEENKPAAFFLHGMADTHAGWQMLWPTLARDYQIVLFDVPWSGREGIDWPYLAQPQRWWQMCLDLVPVPPTLVIGHSFGASVLLEWMTIHAPAGIEAAILFSPFFKERIAQFNWSVLEHYVNRFHELLEDGLKIRLKSKSYSAEDVQSMAKVVRERIAPAGWIEFFRLYLRSPLLALDRMTCPVKLIAGDRDVSVDENDILALARRLPHAQASILPACGHYSLLEQPGIVVSLVVQWLQQVQDCRNIYHVSSQDS